MENNEISSLHSKSAYLFRNDYEVKFNHRWPKQFRSNTNKRRNDKIKILLPSSGNVNDYVAHI